MNLQSKFQSFYDAHAKRIFGVGHRFTDSEVLAEEVLRQTIQNLVTKARSKKEFFNFSREAVQLEAVRVSILVKKKHRLPPYGKAKMFSA